MSQTDKPATLQDVLAALAAVNSTNQQPPVVAAVPVAKEPEGIAKHATTIVVAIFLSLCLGAGTELINLSQTSTQTVTKLDAIGKTLDGISQRQDATTTAVSGLQTSMVKEDGRITALETDGGRLRDRIRILEGQKPLGNSTAKDDE